VNAIRFHQHGGPEVLRYEEAPDPEPSPGHAIVRVRACALNHLDLWERRGLDKVSLPLPHISGSDVSGDVVEAEGYAAGTRVLLQPGVSCGRCRACLAGRDNLCPRYDVLGYMSDGGYAELVRVPLANLVPIPPHVSYVEAAAFPLTFLTAWHMLVTAARVRPGEDVLVLAAGSGVGQAAVQIAKFLGARVLATAGSDDKLARAREIGADEAINHASSTIAADVRRLTGGRGVDVVVEHVGQATWEQSVRSLARGGRVVTCGATTGHQAALDLRQLFARQLSFLGSYMGGKGELLEAASLFFAGRLRPVVDSIFPLPDTANAHRRLEARKQFGKIVLEC
jgi:NADPH:quinone reductase-like Zn-dependent oxidoreductase